MREVQEAVYRDWLERGGNPGGSGAPAPAPATQKAKAMKVVRDPNEPKKPLGAFMLYRQEKQAEVMVEHPGLGPKEVDQYKSSYTTSNCEF